VVSHWQWIIYSSWPVELLDTKQKLVLMSGFGSAIRVLWEGKVLDLVGGTKLPQVFALSL
jgi:hypothetical protein